LSATCNGHNPACQDLRVVIVTRKLGRSGTTTWALQMQGAFRQIGCPVVHIVIGRRRQHPVPDEYAIEYTGNIRSHPLLRAARLLQIHKLAPKWYRDTTDQVANRAVDDLLRQRGWHDHVDLVIKNFSTYSPSCLNRFQLLAVVHQQLSLDWKDAELRSRNTPNLILAAVSKPIAEDAATLGLDIRHVLVNPLDAELLQRKAAEKVIDGEFIVFVGSLYRGKGVYELLEAYAQSQTDLPLWFVGGGKEEAGLKSRADDLGIGQKVKFFGFLHNPYPYIARARLLVLPSHSEAMSYVCMEAGALGTQFLVSDTGGVDDFFTERATISLLPETDFVVRLAQRIRYELEHPCEPGLQPGILEQVTPKAVAHAYLSIIDKGSPTSG
jgi:glycosyltransferase involved in cell wall biosynthesis